MNKAATTATIIVILSLIILVLRRLLAFCGWFRTPDCCSEVGDVVKIANCANAASRAMELRNLVNVLWALENLGLESDCGQFQEAVDELSDLTDRCRAICGNILDCPSKARTPARCQEQ